MKLTTVEAMGESAIKYLEDYHEKKRIEYLNRVNSFIMANKPLSITFKFSKRLKGQRYWVMYHGNGEKMAHSETLKNKSHCDKLAKQFEAMGFVVEREDVR